MIKEVPVHTRSRIEFINIDQIVSTSIRESGVLDGMCHLWVPHTTAALTVNENADPAVVRDILYKTSKMVPEQDPYQHNEGNSDAHVKSSLFGPSLSIIIADGKPLFGVWQSVYFCEFDGPRKRTFFIKVVEG